MGQSKTTPASDNHRAMMYAMRVVVAAALLIVLVVVVRRVGVWAVKSTMRDLGGPRMASVPLKAILGRVVRREVGSWGTTSADSTAAMGALEFYAKHPGEMSRDKA